VRQYWWFRGCILFDGRRLSLSECTKLPRTDWEQNRCDEKANFEARTFAANRHGVGSDVKERNGHARNPQALRFP
jgi:hypothetical protein